LPFPEFHCRNAIFHLIVGFILPEFFMYPEVWRVGARFDDKLPDVVD
jgi:hypothetical protein